MEANEWQSVLRRATEDINLSLALRQSCRAANDEFVQLSMEVTRLSNKTDAMRLEINALRRMAQGIER